MPNYLSQYDPENFPSFRECVVFNGQKVHFTPIGIRRYKERFARAGFDITKIDDAEALDAAMRGSWHIEMLCLTEVLNERRPERLREDPMLNWLDATRNGDQRKAEYWLGKMPPEHRQKIEEALNREWSANDDWWAAPPWV